MNVHVQRVPVNRLPMSYQLFIELTRDIKEHDAFNSWLAFNHFSITTKYNITMPQQFLIWNEYVALPAELHALRKNRDIKADKLTFITIAPKHEVEARHFADAVNKHWGTSKLAKGSEWVFEQKGTTMETIGYHFHTHILLPKPKGISPSQLRARLSWAKAYASDNCIKIQDYPMEFWEEKQQYMKGLKWDEGKHEAVKLDPIYRKQLNLQEIYHA